VNDPLYLAASLAGLSVLLLTLGGLMTFRGRRLKLRLREFLTVRAPVSRAASPPQPATRPRESGAALRWLQRVPFLVKSNELDQAGWSIAPTRFMVMQSGVILLSIGLAFLISSKLGIPKLALIITLPLGVAGGLMLVRTMISVARRRRLSQIEGQFSPALESMANGVQGGLSLLQSLEAVGRGIPAPFGPELTLVVREMAIGASLEQALNHLRQRVPLRDVDLFVSAVLVQHRTGGNLSALLRTLAYTMRERLRIRGELKTLTAQGKLSAAIVALLPIGIMFMIRLVSPGYFERIAEPGLMRLFLLGAAASVVIGYSAMMRIARVEV
jgi:tight adherence protein B